MEQKEFQELLKRLHQELEQAKTVDENSRELLVSVKDDIQKLIHEPEDVDSEHHERLSEKLSEAVDQFEESHPRLVIAMKHVLDSLANMGF
ncbi:MAG: DUF4404 family protein [Chlorobiales bacterium]|jgi:hypothetical protein|nr:DUF4404 family protein [Chlorobiales bacterium]